MHKDPIVEEIRKYRRLHTKKHNNNLDQIFDALKESEKKSNRKTINFGPRLLTKKAV